MQETQMHMKSTRPNYVHNPSLIKPISVVKTIMHIPIISHETKKENVDRCKDKIWHAGKADVYHIPTETRI